MTKKFGDCLREIRIAKEMSQEQLAELLGTTKQVISKYETNQRTPKVTVANDYAIKLNVPLGALLGSGSNRFQPLRLKQYRLSIEENPEVVASKLKVPRHVYLGWEDGSITMFIEQIEDVAEYFGISTDYLYGYTDDPKAGMRKYGVLSFEEQRIGRLYGKADADTQKAVELMLKRFDNEDMEQEETVRVFRAAHTDDRSVPAEYIDMPKSRLQKIKDAPEATDENL